MFNIGFLELVIIGAVALIVIGPDQLPHVARTLGRLLGDLKKATGELSGGLLDATRDVKKTWQDTQDEVQSATKMALGQDSNGLDESQVDDNQESDTSNKDKSENDDSKESQIEGDDGTENPPG